MTLKLLFLFALVPLSAAGAIAAAPAQAAAIQVGVVQSPDCEPRAEWRVRPRNSVDQIAADTCTTRTQLCEWNAWLCTPDRVERTEDGRVIIHIEPREVILTSDPTALAPPTPEPEDEEPEPHTPEPPATTAPTAPSTELSTVEARGDGLPGAFIATAATLLLAVVAAVLVWRRRRRRVWASDEIEVDVELEPGAALGFVDLKVVRTSAGLEPPDGWELADAGPVDRELSSLPEGESRHLRFLAQGRLVHLAARRELLFLDRAGTARGSEAERRATVTRARPDGGTGWTWLLHGAPRTFGTLTRDWRSLWLAVSPLSDAGLVNVRGAAIQYQGSAFLFRGAEVRRALEWPDVAVVRILTPPTPEPPVKRRRLAELGARVAPHVSVTRRLDLQQATGGAATSARTGDVASMARLAIADAAVATPLIVAALWSGWLVLAALALPWVARLATFPSGLAVWACLQASPDQPGPVPGAEDRSWLRWGGVALATTVGVGLACLLWPGTTPVDRVGALVALAVVVELWRSLQRTRAAVLAKYGDRDQWGVSILGDGTGVGPFGSPDRPGVQEPGHAGRPARGSVWARLVRGARRVLAFLSGHDDDEGDDLAAKLRSPLVRRYALWAGGVFVVTGAIQLGAWWMSGIASLWADGFHSVVDAAEAVPIVAAWPLARVIARRRGREPDPVRADAWATLGILPFMALTVVTTVWVGVRQLVAPEVPTSDWRLALGVGVVVGFTGNVIAWRIRNLGASEGSSMSLGASAAHAALDALTSLIVLLAFFGPRVDGAASLVIGALVALSMWMFGRDAYQRLQATRQVRT